MRTFVAAEISDKNLINSIKNFQSKVNIKAKPVETQNLHFTLQFLGEVSEEISQKIKQALQTIEFKTFKVNFKGIGAFPRMKTPRIIWIGTDEVGAKALTDLAKKVENVLAPLGFAPDKPFKSHLTVLRVKNRIENVSKELERFKTEDFGDQEISVIKLKQSVLTPQGPVYSDLEEIKAKS